MVSGLIKVNDVTGFSYKLEEYFIIFDTHFKLGTDALVPYSVGIAMGIAILETVMALFLLIGSFRATTTLVLEIMIIFFTILTGYSAFTGAVSDCGCFGDVIKLTPWQSFGKDLILMFLIGYLYLYHEDITPLLGREGKVPRIMINAVGVVLIIVLSWYCYSYLPVVDFLPYKVGNNLKELSTKTKPGGEAVLKDYNGFCEGNEFKDNVLLIIYPDLEKAKAEQITASVELANALNGSNVKVMGGTASVSAVRQKLIDQYKIPYCLSGEDKTLLKTIIRSNPGYLLLKNGVVVGKWHANSIPSKEKVLDLVK